MTSPRGDSRPLIEEQQSEGLERGWGRRRSPVGAGDFDSPGGWSPSAQNSWVAVW